jgi:hypothetical protein
MSATRVTACVDCSTPIIGGRTRCPACYSQHHAGEAAKPLTLWQALIAWFVAVQLLAVIAIALIMAVRSCG